MDGDLFLEFGGEHIEEAIADLSLRDQRRDVLYLELRPCELIVHLFHVLLQFFGELLALLKPIYFFLMLIEYFSELLYLHRLLTMHLSVILQDCLHILDVHIDISNPLVD